MNNMENGLKSLFLAAVGGTAMTYEGAQKLLSEMVDKGKVSVNEGKELTEDLKRTFKRDTKVSEGTLTEENKAKLTEELLVLRQEIDQLQEEVKELRANAPSDDTH